MRKHDFYVAPDGATYGLKKGITGSASVDSLPQNVQEAYKGYGTVEWKGLYKGQSVGTKAGKKFRNTDYYLPTKDRFGSPIHYKEYDVNAKISGVIRDSERFVRGSDGSLYFTDNHYETFLKIH